MKKIFIAIPYNHPDDEVKKYRLDTIKSHCIKIFEEGNAPVSPLLMGLSLADHGGLPTDTNTWVSYCKTLVATCDEFHVLTVDGWDNSLGVKTEINTGLEFGLEIKYINP